MNANAEPGNIVCVRFLPFCLIMPGGLRARAATTCAAGLRVARVVGVTGLDVFCGAVTAFVRRWRCGFACACSGAMPVFAGVAAEC